MERLEREVRAAYAIGPGAVLSLITRLLAERDAAHAATLAGVEARLVTLEGRVAKDSHNSSMPPSRDPVRVPKSLREPSGRPPGGVQGHRGQTLDFTPTPDVVAVHAPGCCAQCGDPLPALPPSSLEADGGTSDASGGPSDASGGPSDASGGPSVVERRQVTDLPTPPADTPLLPLVVTEHQVADVRCARCGTWTRGTFPPAARTTVQYGPRLAAVGTYLTTVQLLPVRRAAEVLTGLTGRVLSPATLLAFAERGAAALAPTEAALRATLTTVPVLHYDETGLFVDGRSHWLHVASTPTHTHYTTHRSRGRAGAAPADILPRYEGTLVHDSASGYQQYAQCTHALCGAHLLRELTFHAEEQHEPWAAGVARLLRTAKHAVERARAHGATALPRATLARWRRRYATLLATGEAAHPPPAPTGRPGHPKRTPAGNLLHRLRRDADAVWRFATDFRVPFDNNQAERDLRMMKTKQKISGGFRRLAGAAVFCTLRSYLSSAQKQGHDTLAALQALYDGQPLSVAART